MELRMLATRRGLLGGLLGAGAAAVASVGCAAPVGGGDPLPAPGPLPPSGATQVMPLLAGVRSMNVMPDHVAPVRL
jgi:hypothetical protein